VDSIYWVISRDCNQSCRHCYNNSEPGAEGLSPAEVDQVVANFPSAFPVDKIILSGGEPLAWPELLFHTLGRLHERYGRTVPLALQTNGDLLDAPLLDRLLEAHVSHISVSSMDGFHPKSTLQRREYLECLFQQRGCDYAFWGATPEMWIGKIWPRGRAMETRVSKAGPADDFCSRWSGALNFLERDGAEVNIQLASVYPCCPMTVRPIGDLRREPLESILDRCRGNPIYQALNRGRPEEMGVSRGISVEQALERTRELGNCCLWCDEFFLRYAPDDNAGRERIPGSRLDLVQITQALESR
jgi:hypothetical protein